MGAMDRVTRFRAIVWLVLVLVATMTPASPSDSDVEEPASPELQRWLDEVEPLMTAAERALFQSLTRNYQREAFVTAFWRVRDPYPETARNELRERYDERLAIAKARFGDLEDARSRILLVHGEPDRQLEIRCTTTRIPAVIWSYGRSDAVDFGFVVVFLRGNGGTAPAQVWHPDRLAADPVVRQARHCMNGAVLDQVIQSIRTAGVEYTIKLDRVLRKPRPRSTEWVASFYAESTDLHEDAELLEGSLRTHYLGRYQSRAVLQGVIDLETRLLELADFGGYRSYELLLLGEVIRDDTLFERFRYKYGFPGGGDERAVVSLPFQRYLRPGSYRLVVKAEDLNGGRVFRREVELDVPMLDTEFVPNPVGDAETASLFDEAVETMQRGVDSVRLIPPAEGLRTGFVRFNAVVTGEEVDRLVFYLDGQEMLSKNRHPFSVELDMGPFPRLRTVRASAFDAAGNWLAEDQIEVNAGGQRFTVRLVEPSPDQAYETSVQARAEVRVPDDSTLDRVEFYVNEQKVASLFQEPFRLPLRLPDPGALTYIRAVAHLADGDRADDHVFVNSPSHIEEVEVQFVELFAAVQDRAGRPVSDLGRGDFKILEDGVEQPISRFERVVDLPIHVGVVIDNSASMHGALESTRHAALSFFEQAIEAEDRAALITFNRFPHLAVKLTNDLPTLGSGLAGLTAEGQTALYDSLMFALYYFTGVSGQRAILLLSDGRDEVSRFGFAETLEYARRAGVTIYTVGLQLGEEGARDALRRIAQETGGESFFIRDIADLSEVYASIERELRSQYMLAYQSSNATVGGEFRTIEVRVARPDASVRTMSGYYP